MANPRKFSEKIALLNQKQAEETAKFEQIMKEVSDVTSRTALSNLEEMQHNQTAYRQAGGTGTGGAQERGRSMGPGPMRSRPIEKRHDTSPYSGAPYLSPPLPENWRRANSDSALHQSANEACQSVNAGMGHRRDQRGHGGSTTDTRDSGHHHHGFIERPRSSCEMPRVPGINVYPSSQPPGQQIPIGNNTGSLPDLSNVHFPSPLHTPLDQEDHSSGSQYSNNHLSVPVNHRFLHSCKGIALENTSTSQQDVRITYPQQPSQPPPQQQQPLQSQPQNVPGSASPHQTHPGVAHSPGHYVYQQPHSPVAPQSPNASQAQVHPQSSPSQFTSLNSYRTSQMVNRPSPQSSPSLTLQGSPSYSNNPSAPSSPTGHHGPPNLSLGPDDQNIFINQVHADFEQFSMMDSPSTTIGPYMNSPSHSGTYTQNDVLGVASEIGSADGGYFSTSPLQQLAYHTTRTPTTTQQLTPQTPNTPTITLTDCSLGPDDLVGSDFSKDFGPSIAATFGQDLFPTDDALAQDLNSLRHEDINALRQGLDPIDLDELQRLANSDMVISDPTAEADFRLEQR